MGPKRSLEKNISEKGYLPGDKRFLHFLSRNVERDKRHGTIYQGPKGVLEIIVKLQDHFCNTEEVVDNKMF